MPEVSGRFSDFAPVVKFRGIREIPLSELSPATPFSPWKSLAIGARLRSIDVLQQLTREATSNECDWNEALSRLRTGSESAQLATSLPEHWDAAGIAAAVLLACVLDPTPEHFELARDVLLRVNPGLDYLEPGAGPALMLSVQIAALTGSSALLAALDQWRETNSDLFWAADTDLLRWRLMAAPTAPDVAAPSLDAPLTAAEQEWWASVNEPITTDGIEPFELRTIGPVYDATCFTAIHAPILAPLDSDVDRPLVSIIVPVFNPSEDFLNTIESLTRQTWGALEILVVDDCSTSGLTFINSAEASDPRVRVVRMPSNGGTYRAFDAGISEARGAFVTFQGADDISHSRRIELQMGPLLNRSSLIATMSRSQRMSADGSTSYFGFDAHRTNVSSLLYRKDPVTAALGRFDAARKGADSEFQERLIAVFGASAVETLPQVLSVVQLTPGSLSRSDFRFGWQSGSRQNYIAQYRGHIERYAAGDLSGLQYTSDRPGSGWIPARISGEPAPKHLAVAALADWSNPVELAQGWAAEIHDWNRATDAPVGLLRGFVPRMSTTQRASASPALWASVDAGAAVWLGWEDPTEIDVLMVTDPEYLRFLPNQDDCQITVREVWIVAEATARRFGVLKPRLAAVADVERRIAEHFNAETRWVTQSPRIFETVQRSGGTVLQGTVRSWQPASSSLADQVLPRARRGTTRIGVPAPSPADRLKWDGQKLSGLFPDALDAEVMCFDEFGYYGEERTPPAHWTVVRGADMSREEFLAQIDILVVDPTGKGLLSVASWVAAGVRADVVVTGPRDYAADFGDLLTTFLRRGERDLLTLLALDADLRHERASVARNESRSIAQLLAASDLSGPSEKD